MPTIFNKKATDKLRNPDDLDKYVRVTNPSVWVALAACVVLIAGLLAWGLFGAVTTSVTVTGTVVDGTALCFASAEEVAQISKGDAANFGGQSMKVGDVAQTPLSPEEIKDLIKSDYLVDALVKDNWAHQITFEGDTSELIEKVPTSVVITTDRIAPISLILKNWG